MTVLELRGVGSASLWFDLQTGPDSFGVSRLSLCAQIMIEGFLTSQLVRVRFSTGVDTCVGQMQGHKESAGQHKGAKVNISERTNQSVAKVIILSRSWATAPSV